MKKVKLNFSKLQLNKEKVANLTPDQMYKLYGGIENTTLCETDGHYQGNKCYNPTTDQPPGYSQLCQTHVNCVSVIQNCTQGQTGKPCSQVNCP